MLGQNQRRYQCEREHVKAVSEGDTVTATARLQSRGRKLHVWHIDIRDSAGELISTVQVTNYIVTPRKNG